MNTKQSKITLKKQDLPLRNLSTQSYARMSRELCLSRLRILGKFLWNFSEMLKSIFSLCTDPLPSIKIGGEWGLYTGYQSSASKGYCVTDVRVMPLFCTAHPLLSITLLHPRWRRFFPLSRKEQTRAAFAEPKLLFAIIMPQIGSQLPCLLSKNKKIKKCA